MIFSFAIGGVGAVHRFHRIALLVPFASFIPLALLPWNSIYAAVLALSLGSAASVLCRPRPAKKTLIGGALFLGLYVAFMVGLVWSASGYLAQVWNLPALSGVLIYGIPLEELLFGAVFGLYWSGAYEHLTWTESVAYAKRPISS